MTSSVSPEAQVLPVLDRSPLLVTFALCGCLLLAACSGTDQLSGETAPSALYQQAIEDARTADPSEIRTSLTPIAPYNDDLTWRTPNDSTRQVLVVTWTDANAAARTAPGDTLRPNQDVWVTPVPAVRQFCRRLERSGPALDLRLAQLLGLPPNIEYDRFVELWVRPSALVRPCPDPEITDRECELSFPQRARHAQVSSAHRDWFRTLQRTSYGSNGFPFTGLGYTYDWNPRTDEMGVSEFVIRPGKTAIVHRVEPTGAYCRVTDETP